MSMEVHASQQEMQPKKFYIADWHYNHAKIITMDHRPFADVSEMNSALHDRWNRTVQPCDTVYILGDMYWNKMTEALGSLSLLHGHKILVRGNHDRCNDGRFFAKFDSVEPYMEIEDNGRHVVLCHYPIPCFKNHFYGWYHLYGHVHATFEWEMTERFRAEMIAHGHKCQMYNVGAMMPWMDYTPRTLDEIIAGEAEWKARQAETN